jgi:hypothetical protein
MVAAVAFLLAGCGSGEKAALARADSLQAVIQRRTADSVRAAEKHTSDSILAAKRVADSLLAERMRPRNLQLFQSTGTTLAASKFADFAFVIDSAGLCMLTGRVEATGGGKKDVQVLVMGEDQFTNWVNNAQGEGMALSANPRQTVTSLNVALPSAGQFRLVISNRFSVMTPKDVRGEAEVTCQGVQPRAAT